MRLIFIVLFFVSSFAYAQKNMREKEDSRVHMMLAGGAEMRPEKSIDNKQEVHNLTNYVLGIGYKNLLFLLERATFRESSGNATLSVERTLEDTLFWTHWRAEAWKSLTPFLGAGVGGYKDRVTTHLAGVASSTRESNQRFLTGACLGLQIQVPILWLSIEGRLLFGDELDQQPTPGAVFRAGLWF